MTIAWTIEASRSETRSSPRGERPAPIGVIAIVGQGAPLSVLRTTAMSAVIAGANELELATFMMLRAGPWFTPSAEARALDRWEKSRSSNDVEIMHGSPHGSFGPTKQARGSLYAWWFRATGEDASKIETLEKHHREAFFVLGHAASFDPARYAGLPGSDARRFRPFLRS